MNGLQTLSLAHINGNTPIGGNLLSTGAGATFRVWAPAAQEVKVLWEYTKTVEGDWCNNQEAKLQQTGDGFWGGFVSGLKAGDRYMYYVAGPLGGTTGPKRDPYTRDLTDDPAWVCLTLTTNGTIFSDAIATFLEDHAFKVCISCDGPPHVQNLLRRTSAGEDTGVVVEPTLKTAQQALSTVLVNAVYHPQTFRHLPETLDYLSELGLRRIFLNPDYSARWTRAEAEELPSVYRPVADRYITWSLNEDPHFVNLIETKIAVLIRGGYHPVERCQMGTGELAIVPDGGVYPCERLIGFGTDDQHRIGSVEHGLDLSRLACRCAPGGQITLNVTIAR